MVYINLSSRNLFGNEAGEDEELSLLNSYFIDNPAFEDFYDDSQKLSIVSARKGMGKSALLAKLNYNLNNEEIYNNPLVIRTTGTDLLGLGNFDGKNHQYLENYWKQIICKRIIIEIGAKIGFAFDSNAISMVELAEIEGLKRKNIIGSLISRVIPKISDAEVQFKTSTPDNLGSLLCDYQETHTNSNVWILIDDIDAKFQNTTENQNLVSSFFSAIRSLSVEMQGLKIRTTVRSDVWSSLRHIEDLDKLQQYIIEINWTKKHMLDMLAQKILIYIQTNHPTENEAKYKLSKDYNKILDTVFKSPIEWRGNIDARLFDAISAFSNRRPRWMGQLCRMAGKKAKEQQRPPSKFITLEHINYILTEYGSNRRDDLIKEHNHQFSDLVNLINSLRATKKEFTQSELHEILERNYIQAKANIPPIDGKEYSSVEDLGDFLFKLGLISRIHEDTKKFTHFTDDPDLYRSVENRLNNIKWSIHPAYRNFLNIH